MADLKEYQRQEVPQSRIEPTGFSRLGEQSSAASTIASSITATASAEFARQAGAQAAESGVKPRLPAFTQSDAEFVKAYEQTAYDMHYAQGSQYLAEQARVAMRNPTPSSLSEYQGAYSEYLPDALNSVSEPVARRIRSDLDRSYYHYYNQLANAVDDRNRQVLQQDFSASTDAALKSMSSYLFGGDKDNAKLVRDNLLERQAASFESLQLTDAERTAYVDKIDLVYQQSELVGELHQLHERGKDAEVRSRLSELAELPPTEENLSLTKAAMTYVSNYEGAKESQYQLNYLRAQTD